MDQARVAEVVQTCTQQVMRQHTILLRQSTLDTGPIPVCNDRTTQQFTIIVEDLGSSLEPDWLLEVDAS